MTGREGEVALTFRLGAPSEEVWAIVRGFADVATWNPFLAASRQVSGAAGEIGAIREVVTGDGATVREQLEELDETARTLGYRMLSFPIPVTEQHNRIAVAGNAGNQAALVTFSARFRPDGETRAHEAAEMNRTAFATAAQGLGRALNVEVGPAN